jgi:hypothetical protein
MGLRGRLKKLAREAEREMVVFELEDGTTACFHQDEFLDCFVHESERGRRHYFGEEPGPAHPMIEALRKVSDEEMTRVMREHGTLLGQLVGEDQIIRGERERPGRPVRETSPGVYE